jgi:hypothetical protein
MNKLREIVIARYNEDISWSDNFHDIRTIYNKGEQIAGVKSIQLPNVGRESHTYLYHIITNWNNLAEQTFFCQGDINKHRIAQADIETFFESPGLFKSQGLYRDSNWGYINHLGKWNDEKTSGKMKKAELSFGAWFDQTIKTPRGDFFFFQPGANFCVHKKVITSRSCEFYKTLMKRIENHINPEEGHYFERAWIYIFGLRVKFPQKKIL